MAYWILKTDADVYSYDDLERERRATWDGVSNALALRHIRSMAAGDEAFIYHSNVGKDLVGLARITSAPYPDPKLKDPKIVVVDLEAVRRLPSPVPLSSNKGRPCLRRSGPGPDVAALCHSGAGAAVEEAAGDGRRLGPLK